MRELSVRTHPALPSCCLAIEAYMIALNSVYIFKSIIATVSFKNTTVFSKFFTLYLELGTRTIAGT